MKRLLALLITAVTALSVFSTPVFATSAPSTFGVDTIILNTCGDDDDGITCILNLVVDVFTIGVGILGVVGISVAGIQYLTASGDEAKMRKAKRRIVEIVIGLALYAVMFAFLILLRISPK